MRCVAGSPRWRWSFSPCSPLDKLAHLPYGLAAILGFIGVKLVLHWAHEVGPWVPSVPTLASLGVILAILAVTTTTSLVAARRTAVVQQHADPEPTSQPDPQETWA